MTWYQTIVLKIALRNALEFIAHIVVYDALLVDLVLSFGKFHLCSFVLKFWLLCFVIARLAKASRGNPFFCVDCHKNPCGFSRNDDSAVDSPCDRGESFVSVPLNADFSRLCLYLVRLSLADFRCFVPLSIRENASSSLLTMYF